MLHVSTHLHHLQTVLSFCFAKATKTIQVAKLLKSTDQNVYITDRYI